MNSLQTDSEYIFYKYDHMQELRTMNETLAEIAKQLRRIADLKVAEVTGEL